MENGMRENVVFSKEQKRVYKNKRLAGVLRLSLPSVEGEDKLSLSVNGFYSELSSVYLREFSKYIESSDVDFVRPASLSVRAELMPAEQAFIVIRKASLICYPSGKPIRKDFTDTDVFELNTGFLLSKKSASKLTKPV